MGNHKRCQGPVSRVSQPAVTYETVIPNPKLKLLDQVPGGNAAEALFDSDGAVLL